MIKNIKNRKSMAFMALRILWNFSLLILGAIATLASDKRYKPRYPAAKAQQLYEDGVISGAEYTWHIFGD
jgi:hypothetical protein